MLRNAALAIGGLGAAGFGGYYIVQSTEVSKFDKEQKDVEKLVDTERQRAEGSRKAATEAEQTVQQLRKRSESQKQGLTAAAAALEEKRKDFAAAEAALASKQADFDKVAKEISSTLARISQLKNEESRSREAATLGEKSLVVARQQTEEARQRLNPLRHPKVMALLGSTKK